MQRIGNHRIEDQEEDKPKTRRQDRTKKGDRETSQSRVQQTGGTKGKERIGKGEERRRPTDYRNTKKGKGKGTRARTRTRTRE